MTPRRKCPVCFKEYTARGLKTHVTRMHPAIKLKVNPPMKRIRHTVNKVVTKVIHDDMTDRIVNSVRPVKITIWDKIKMFFRRSN